MSSRHEPPPPLHLSRVESLEGAGELLQAAVHVAVPAVGHVSAATNVVHAAAVQMAAATAAAAVLTAAGHQPRVGSFQESPYRTFNNPILQQIW